MIFSAYRRDDFADADNFVLQLGMVLEKYADAVIHAVCDPRTGIQRRCKFPPSIAEVVEACEAEATAIETRKRYAAIPKPEFRRPQSPPAGPGAWATIRVGPNAPQYERFKARTATADAREWYWDGSILVVPWSWFEAQKSELAPFRPFTDDELRERYGTVAAAEQGDECEEVPF